MPQVRMPHEDELLNHEALKQLASFYIAVGKSRREFASWLAHEIFLFEGEIVDAEGNAVDFEDVAIDAAFNRDGSFRWLTDFRQFATTPPRQKPQRRVIPRLQLIAVAKEIHRIKNDSTRITLPPISERLSVARRIVLQGLPSLPRVAIRVLLRWM